MKLKATEPLLHARALAVLAEELTAVKATHADARAVLDVALDQAQHSGHAAPYGLPRSTDARAATVAALRRVIHRLMAAEGLKLRVPASYLGVDALLRDVLAE